MPCRRVAVAVFACWVVLGEAAGAQGAGACGVERWRVKIAADGDIGRVDTAPRSASVRDLRLLERPPRPLPYNRRIAPHELHVFRVRAILRQVIDEADGDWHLILEDPEGTGQTIVGEIPDSACAVGSRFAGRFAAARRVLRTAPRRAIVELDGIGFFDYVHGQRGMAPNGFELHPILQVTVLGDAAAAPDTVVDGSTKVWVNSASRVYHCPGTRWYGATKAGYFTSEQAAAHGGALPAYGRRCSTGRGPP